MAPGYRASANYMNAPAPPPTHLHDPPSGTSKVRKDVCQSNSACPPCDGTSVCPRTTSDRQLLTLMLKIFILFRNSARFAGAIFDRIMNHVFVLCIGGVDWGSQSALDPERDIHSEYLYRVWFEKASFVDQALRANPLQVDL